MAGPDPAAGAAGAAGAAPWVVVARGAVRLVVNLADAPQHVPVEGAGRTTEVLATFDGAEVVDGAVLVPAHAPAVLRVGLSR